MSVWRRVSGLLAVCVMMGLGACASLQRNDPLLVSVAGVEPLEGQGLELRLLVRLRIQNPNDAAVEYNGVALRLDVRGKTLASGVSDAIGGVPRFGESVITVPVTASAFNIVRQVVGFAENDHNGKIDYVLKGKLNGALFRSVRFESKGELQLPQTTSKTTTGTGPG